MQRIMLRAALAATCVLMLASGVASASGGLQVGSEAVEQTLTSASVTFSAEGAFSVRCPLTLTGEVDGVTDKVAGVPGGAVLRATLGTCEGGTLSLLTGNVPWGLNYVSFSGTLPVITGYTVDIEHFSDVVTVFGVRCLYEGSLRGSFNGTRVTQLSISRSRIPLREGGLCPSTETVSGTLTASPTMTLTLFVSRGGGGFAASPASLEFGMRETHTETTMTTALQNSFDDRDVHIRRIEVNGSAEFTTSPILEPGEQIRIRRLSQSQFRVIFSPLAPGNYAATIELIGLNGTAILQIPVRGSA